MNHLLDLRRLMDLSDPAGRLMLERTHKRRNTGLVSALLRGERSPQRLAHIFSREIGKAWLGEHMGAHMSALLARLDPSSEIFTVEAVSAVRKLYDKFGEITLKPSQVIGHIESALGFKMPQYTVQWMTPRGAFKSRRTQLTITLNLYEEDGPVNWWASLRHPREPQNLLTGGEFRTLSYLDPMIEVLRGDLLKDEVFT